MVISVENILLCVDTYYICKDYKYNAFEEMIRVATIFKCCKLTKLAWDFDEVDLLPDLSRKHSAYEVEDIFYYNVPTHLPNYFLKTKVTCMRSLII